MVYTGKTNTTKCRIVPKIALRESSKDGGHFFMLIYTGIDIHSDY